MPYIVHKGDPDVSCIEYIPTSAFNAKDYKPEDVYDDFSTARADLIVFLQRKRDKYNEAIKSLRSLSASEVRKNAQAATV